MTASFRCTEKSRSPLYNVSQTLEEIAMRLHPISLLLFIVAFALIPQAAFGQTPSSDGTNASRGPGRPVTIPLTIRFKEPTELKEGELQNIDLTISEDGEPQPILDRKSVV